MVASEYEKFFALLHRIVNADSAVNDKKQALLAEASDQDKTNLAEFQSWFEEEDFD